MSIVSRFSTPNEISESQSDLVNTITDNGKESTVQHGNPEIQHSVSQLKKIAAQVSFAAMATLSAENASCSDDTSHQPWRIGGVLGLAKGFYSGDLYLGRGVGKLEGTHLELGVELGNEAEKLATLSNKENVGHYWRTAPHLNLLAGIAWPIYHFDMSISGLIGFNYYQYPRVGGKSNTDFLPTWQLQADIGRPITKNLTISVSWVLAAPIGKRIEEYDLAKPIEQQDRSIHFGQTLQLGAIRSF